jgi:excinuclease UvrABC nuclease subunit
VEELLGFLEGRDPAPRARLTERRDRLADELRFEAAARTQRDLDVLTDVERRRRTLSWIVTRQNFVVLLPSDARDAAHLYAVLGGRLAVEARLTATDDVRAVATLVRERFARYQDTPLAREEVDGSTILAAWLRDRNASQGCAPIATAFSPARA